MYNVLIHKCTFRKKKRRWKKPNNNVTTIIMIITFNNCNIVTITKPKKKTS